MAERENTDNGSSESAGVDKHTCTHFDATANKREPKGG